MVALRDYRLSGGEGFGGLYEPDSWLKTGQQGPELG
jgi:hypothetical protein